MFKRPTTEIKYCVAAIGYDKDFMVTDYEKDITDLCSLNEANFSYANVLSTQDKIFENVPDNVTHMYVQLEKCEYHKDFINCIDIIQDVWLDR